MAKSKCVCACACSCICVERDFIRFCCHALMWHFRAEPAGCLQLPQLDFSEVVAPCGSEWLQWNRGCSAPLWGLSPAVTGEGAQHLATSGFPQHIFSQTSWLRSSKAATAFSLFVPVPHHPVKCSFSWTSCNGDESYSYDKKFRNFPYLLFLCHHSDTM